MQAGIERQRAIADHEIKVQEQQREIADKAAAREQFLSMKDTLADEFETHSAGVIDGTIDKTSARTKWAEKTKAMIDLGVEKVPPSQRAQVQSQLSFDAGRYERLVGRAVAKKDQTDTLGSINAQLEFAARMSEMDYEGARLMAMDALQQFGPAAGLNSNQIQEKANKWKEEAAYTRGLGLITRAKKDNVALGKAEEQLGKMADLDPRQRVQLQGTLESFKAQNDQRALAAAHKAELEAARRERKAASAWETVSTLVANGKMPDEPTIQRYQQAMKGTEYELALPELLKQVPAQAAVATKPVGVQQAELDELRARAVKGTNPGLEKEIKRREQVLASSKSDYQTDPIGAHIERGLAQPTALDFNAPETLAARAEQAKEIAIHTGKPVGILRPHEATYLSQQFEKLNAGEKEALVRRIYEGTGPSVGMATFAQLGKEAPLMAVAAGLSGRQTTGKDGNGSKRSVSQLIFEGQEMLKTKAVSIPGGDKPENSGVMEDEFFKYAGTSIPNPKARLAAVEAASMIYAKLMHEQGRVNEKGINAKVFRQAASFVTGGTIDYNGAKILPPVYGLDEDQSRNLLRGVTPANVKAWGSVQGMTDEEAAKFIRNATLESQTIGRYRVLAGSGILTKPDGSPFEMTFK